MRLNRLYRCVSALAIAFNASALTGLSLSWLLSRLIKSGVINGGIAVLATVLLILLILGVWYLWFQEYKSDSPTKLELAYRYSFPSASILAILFGLLSFGG